MTLAPSLTTLDALVAALEHWPRDGVPDNPGAWLMTTAKRRALDHLRRNKLHAERVEELGQDLEAQEALVVPDFVDALEALLRQRVDERGLQTQRVGNAEKQLVVNTSRLDDHA